MRTVMYILTTIAVVGLAFWAYRENYVTQQALSDADRLHANIRAAHARLAVLRAEWAFQNRPDRLRDLADLNFDRLGLFLGHLAQPDLRPGAVRSNETNVPTAVAIAADARHPLSSVMCYLSSCCAMSLSP